MKFLLALWYGSKFTVETVPRRMLRESLSQMQLSELLSQVCHPAPIQLRLPRGPP